MVHKGTSIVPQPHHPVQRDRMLYKDVLRAFTAFIISNQAACRNLEGNTLSYKDTPKIPLECYGRESGGGRIRGRSRKRMRLKEDQCKWKRKRRKAGGVCLENIRRLEH